jgi:hypothetical protein
MVFGYAHGGYLMARTTPSPDVEDDVGGWTACQELQNQQLKVG